MKADLNRRHILGAAMAALLLAGCEPGAEGGYDRIVYRPAPAAVDYDHPDPPPVIAGTQVGAVAAPLVVSELPPGVTQAMVDAGQQSYGMVCGACHGPAGIGSPAGPALNDGDWIHIGGSYDEIVAIINSGVPNPRQYPGVMLPRGGGSYSDDDVRNVAAYVWALSRQEGA